MDVMFYHLLHTPLERALPQLLEKTLERSWRAVVQAGGDERVAMLNDHLWTWSQESFLPHGAAGDGDADLQPIYLTTGAENPNGAQVRFFIDGVDLAAAATAGAPACERMVLMFDGRDEEQVLHARGQWKRLKESGLAPQYWRQRENGGWEKVAE